MAKLLLVLEYCVFTYIIALKPIVLVPGMAGS